MPQQQLFDNKQTQIQHKSLNPSIKIKLDMQRTYHSTFFTDFNSSMITSTQPSSSNSAYRAPRYSSFMTRMKTNTKNRIIKYHLKEKKEEITPDNIYKTTGLKVQSLIKIQKEMSSLRLNITTCASFSRKPAACKTMSASIKIHSSMDKFRKTTERKFMNKSCIKMGQNDSKQIKTNRMNRRLTSTSFANRTQPKQFNYEQFFGNSKDSNIERASIAQQKYFRDSIWKVAFSNQHILQVKERPRVYIGKGNNSKLIKSLMRNRWWWTIEKEQAKAEFVWTQLKISSIYTNQRQSPIKKYQDHQQNQNPKIIVRGDPALQLMNAAQYTNYSAYLKQNIKLQRKNLGDFACRKTLEKNINIIEVNKVTNHIQYSRMIGNKKALFYTMRQYYALINKNCTQYLPLTFHIAEGFEDPEYSSFTRLFNQRKRNDEQNIWIVKPGQLSNRGNGITVCNSIDQIKTIIKSKKKHHNGKTKTYIIQLYMSDPFLYKDRKFDIRHYIMITSINSLIKGYWYEEGYIRTTSSQFNLTNFNGLVHLTNDAVQKHGKDYGKYEKGNKVSYQQFQTYLDTKYGQNTYKFDDILKKMKQIGTDVMKASFLSLDPKRRQHNFQIFGMDFMIDNSWKPYLIQINTNPCLQLSSPLLAKLIPAMVENALKIGLDPLFPPPPLPANKKFTPSENKFELIFDQLTEASSIQKLYEGQKKISEILDDIGSDDEAYEDADQDDI